MLDFEEHEKIEKEILEVIKKHNCDVFDAVNIIRIILLKLENYKEKVSCV